MANTTRSPFLLASDGHGKQFVIDGRFVSGNVFFVNGNHSNKGDTAGRGQTPDAPFSTIDYAIGQCTADNDDLIIVLPGHTESITGAAGIALDVAGVKVLGVGDGRRRPRVTFTTAAAASFDISAARCVVENLVLINGIDAQTAMVNVTGADCVIRGCELMLGDATTQAVLGILTTAAANRLQVLGNDFHGTVDAGVTAAIRLVGGDAITVEGNRIQGAFAVTGAIHNVTTATTGLLIWNNTILNQTADGNNTVIVLAATSTGLIANNRGGIIDSTSPAPVTAAAAWVSGNYWSTAVGIAASTLM